jgi:glycogen operon protein
MTDEAWSAGFVKCIAVGLVGTLIHDVDERGQRIVGDSLILMLNAHHEEIPFTVPVSSGRGGFYLERLVDTTEPLVESKRFEIDAPYPLQAHSLALFRVCGER